MANATKAFYSQFDSTLEDDSHLWEISVLVTTTGMLLYNFLKPSLR